MKRVACYVRVSTEEQKKHGLSVDSQIEALTAFCKANNYEVIGIYNDAGISARKRYTKRPALLQLIADCQAKKVDLIIITKLDRFFRSVADYYEVMSKIGGTPWKAIWEDYETETSAGVFKVNIMLSVAQSEADRTSERIKAVNDFKRAKGDYVGKAPTGYLIRKGELVIDEELKDAVKTFFEMFLDTHSLAFSIKKARAKGLNVTKETAIRMTKNSAYKGEAFGGYKCEPYLTEEQWDMLQTIRIRKDKEFIAKQQRHYYFSGIMYCADCGGRMLGTVRRMKCGSEKKAYKYYRCKHHDNLLCTNQRSITEMKLERYLIANVDRELHDFIFSSDFKPIETVDYKQKIYALEAKLRRIGERYEDGDITRDEYRTKRSAILEQLEELKLQDAQKNSTPQQLPSNWLDIYSELDDEHKKLFWSATIKKITLDSEGNIGLFF